jgi:tetratricopeptide (TPR) repeat protein
MREKELNFNAALLLVCIATCSYAQHADNEELQKMHDEDQRARSVPNINWLVLSRQDSLREARVHEMIRDGKIITAKDYYNSAMIFQHGRDTIASSMAVKHMRKAIELDSTMNRWLLAAAIDRDLMRRGQPQIYGTQYVKESMDAKWSRYKIDSTKVTDVERKYYGVETLAEQKVKEYEMNLLSISDYYAQTNSLEKTMDLIKSEFKKKKQATYNVGEIGLLIFGDELMNSDKKNEALKILKLNTELNPNGYRAFHYYGDCLLQLGKKKEAINAYKRSLEINPDDKSVAKILEGLAK